MAMRGTDAMEFYTMTKRVALFSFISLLTALGLGATGLFGTGPTGMSQQAALIWSVLGVAHGIVLFGSSIGDTPTIENTRSGRLVRSSLADRFDYRRFGHRILYIAVAFGLAVTFVVSPLLGEGRAGAQRSMGIQLLIGIVVSFLWTAICMVADIVLVSKLALR